MKTLKKIQVIFALLFLVSIFKIDAQTTINAGNVSGEWNEAGSPYTLSGAIVIATGDTLRITKNTIVQTANSSITVHGVLLVIGNYYEPVVFENYSQITNSIQIIDGKADFQFARIGHFRIFEVENSELHISNSKFGDCIKLKNKARAIIRSSEFIKTWAAAESAFKAEYITNDTVSLNIDSCYFENYTTALKFYMISTLSFEVTRCHLLNNTYAISLSNITNTNTGIIIRENLIHNNIRPLEVAMLAAANFPNAPIIANNTIYDNDYFPGFSNCIPVHFANNIVYRFTSILNLSQVTFENNIIELSKLNTTQQSFFDGSNIDVDPLLDIDYSLLSNSPAIDAGNSQYAFANIDFNGDLRIVDGNNDGSPIIDIGAFEYYNPIFITGVVTPANGISNQGGSIQITITGTSGLYQEFNWNDLNHTITKDLLNVPVGEYLFQVIDMPMANFAMATFTVGFTQEPFNLIASVDTIYNLDLQLYPLEISAISNPNIATYEWSNGWYGETIMISEPGWYFVTATFESGMIVTDSIEVINEILGLSLQGIVTANSINIENAEVSMYSITDTINPIQTKYTNSNGEYNFNGLVQGEYYIVANPNLDIINDYFTTIYFNSSNFVYANSILVDADIIGIDIDLLPYEFTTLYQNNIELQVYPNPASDYITIHRNATEIDEIRLYSIQGTLVKKSFSNTVCIEDLTQGVYQGIVIIDSIIHTFEFIKN